ncbi:MAG TPA: PsiF family protein [Steroidobacteraceae bacterium]|nr:PsiF family protein [Steroidobacteraceae bacterium]
MRHLRIPALAVLVVLGLGMTVGATAQTSRSAVMKECNVQANSRHLMGRDRQTFMKACLSSPRGRQLALNTQQRRMQYCNAQARAKGLMGSDRSRYVSRCLRAR